jgi:hypothetical protein
MPTGTPAESEYAPYYARYVSMVTGDDALFALEGQRDEVARLLAAVPEARETFRYAEGKWSVRQVFGHLIDAERVFGYRAFCIGRGEQAALPSFDQNAYVTESRYAELPLQELGRELLAARELNLVALRRLGAEAWLRRGTASDKPVSVRAVGFIMAGHLRYHAGILRERYGIG